VTAAIVIALASPPAASEGPSEAGCKFAAIYYESSGSSLKGQRAVLTVLENRMRIRDMTACEVVAEKGQWSWYGKKPMKEMTGKMREWLSRVESSRKVLGNRVEYFHNGSVKPKWARKMELVAQINGHKFYKERT
jgi:spore germination cell wall hydrolase CwlJ-like protein